MSVINHRYFHHVVATGSLTTGAVVLIIGLMKGDIKMIVSGGALIALSLTHVFRMLRMRAPSPITATQSTL